MSRIVGLNEIAERLGVKLNTVRMWRKRDLLPAPAGFVSGTPWWYWPTIEAWVRQHRSLAPNRPLDRGGLPEDDG